MIFKRLGLKAVSCVTAFVFLWVNCVWAGPVQNVVHTSLSGETLALWSQAEELLSEMRVRCYGAVTLETLVRMGIADQAALYRMWDEIRGELGEKIGPPADELRILVLDGEREGEMDGGAVIYTFHPEEGYLFSRRTTVKGADDPLNRLIRNRLPSVTGVVDPNVNALIDLITSQLEIKLRGSDGRFVKKPGGSPEDILKTIADKPWFQAAVVEWGLTIERYREYDDRVSESTVRRDLQKLVEHGYMEIDRDKVPYRYWLTEKGSDEIERLQKGVDDFKDVQELLRESIGDLEREISAEVTVFVLEKLLFGKPPELIKFMIKAADSILDEESAEDDENGTLREIVEFLKSVNSILPVDKLLTETELMFRVFQLKEAVVDSLVEIGTPEAYSVLIRFLDENVDTRSPWLRIFDDAAEGGAKYLEDLVRKRREGSEEEADLHKMGAAAFKSVISGAVRPGTLKLMKRIIDVLGENRVQAARDVLTKALRDKDVKDNAAAALRKIDSDAYPPGSGGTLRSIILFFTVFLSVSAAGSVLGAEGVQAAQAPGYRYDFIVNFISANPVLLTAIIVLGLLSFILRPFFKVRWYIWRLGSKKMHVRQSALEALKRFDALTLELEIKKYIADLKYAAMTYDSDLQRDAIDNLVKIGRPAVPALVETLGYGHAGVRNASIDVLGQIGPEAEAAVPALMDILKLNWQCRRNAARAISKIGKPAVPALMDILTSAGWVSKSEEEKLAVESLVSIARSTNDVALLRQILSSNESHVRLAAVEALGKMEPVTEEIISILTKSLTDKSDQVAREAVEALGEKNPATVKGAIPVLIQVLIYAMDKVNRKRKGWGIFGLNILLSLVGSGRSSHLGLFDDVSDARQLGNSVVKILRKIGPVPKEIIHAVIRSIDNSNIQFISTAEDLVSFYWNMKDIPLLIGMLSARDARIRGVAAQALDDLGALTTELKVRRYMLDLRETSVIRDPVRAGVYVSYDVRENAVNSLGEIGPDARESVPDLISILEDEIAEYKRHRHGWGWPFCRSVIRALGKIGDPRAVSSLIKALNFFYFPFLSHEKYPFYSDAYSALGSIARSTHDVTALTEIMSAEGGISYVREAAQKALEDIIKSEGSQPVREWKEKLYSRMGDEARVYKVSDVVSELNISEYAAERILDWLSSIDREIEPEGKFKGIEKITREGKTVYQWLNPDSINSDIFRDYDYRSNTQGSVDFSPKRLFFMTLAWIYMAKGKAEGLGMGNNRVLIARDCRKTDPGMAEAVIRAVEHSGLQAVYIGEKPNSAASYAWAVRKYRPLMGIFLTASHLKAEDAMGAKVSIRGRSGELESLTTQEVKQVSRELLDRILRDPNRLGLIGREPVPRVFDDVESTYIQMATLANLVATGMFKQGAETRSLYELGADLKSAEDVLAVLKKYEDIVDREAKRFSGLKVVVEAAHTPSGKLAGEVYRALGAEVIILHEEVRELTGYHKADPAKMENLGDLMDKMEETGAHFGVAFDLDGDRGSVVVPTKEKGFVSKRKFTVVSPGDLTQSLLPFFDKRGYSAAQHGKVAVVRDVVSTRGIDEKARELGYEPYKTDAGYTFVKQKREQLEEQGYTVPICAEGVGHSFTHVAGAFEDPIMVSLFFAVMVKEYMDKNAQSTYPFNEALSENTVPYMQSVRFQPLFGEPLLGELGWTPEQGKPTTAVIASGRHRVIDILKEDFKKGAVFRTPAGELMVSEMEVYKDPQTGEYRYADIRFSLNGRDAGSFVFRASSNDPTWVCIFEVPLGEGETFKSESLQVRYDSVGGVVLDYLETKGYARVAGEGLEYNNKEYVEGALLRYRGVVDQKEIFISTAGGAALEFLAEKGRLPVLENLKVDGNYLTVRDIEFNGRRVVVRVDFNVPVEVEFDDKGQIKRITITDDTRIRAALPTIIHILGQNPQYVTLVTHFEPKVKLPGKEKKEKIALSTEVIAQKLRELLPSIYQDKVVFLTESVRKDGLTQEAIDSITELEGPKVILLENIRFAEGEKEGSPELIRQLSSLADIYVVDAFGTVHRPHASLLPERGVTRAVGLLVEKEITYLSKALEPKRPLVLISGGAKLEGKKGEKGKIDIIKAFLEIMQSGDVILIGGAVAYTFLKAQDDSINLGNSLIEEDKIDLAKQILVEAKKKGIKVILPVDHIAVTELSRDAKGKSIDTPSVEVPAGYMAVDIGVGTIALFLAELDKAQTIVWNGPLGVFEEKQGGFIEATSSLAERLIKLAGTGTDIIVGGGETGEAIKQKGLLETEASKGSHLTRKLGRRRWGRIFCVMNSIEELKDYNGAAREMLDRLEHIYGSGIFIRIKEIQIVENIKGGRLYPQGRAPLAGYENGVLKIDEMLFKLNKWVLFEQLEHELLESIGDVVPGSSRVLSDIVATLRNVLRFLDPNSGVTNEKYKVDVWEYRHYILSVNEEDRTVDPDKKYRKLLTGLLQMQEKGELSHDFIVACVISYVMRSKLYRTVKDELGLSKRKESDLATYLRRLSLLFDDALSVFDAITSAVKGKELIEQVKESSDITVKVVKTFTGLRIEGISGLSERLQRMIGLTAKQVYNTDKLAGYVTKAADTKYILLDSEKLEELKAVICEDEYGRIEKSLRDNNYQICTKMPDGVALGNIIRLVDPADLEKMPKVRGMLYLPMPYTRSSLYMAAKVVEAGGIVRDIDSLVKEFVRDLYSQITGESVSDRDLFKLFTRPWDFLPEIRKVIDDLNSLRKAAFMIDKAA